jgi:hypothetical protein
MSFPLIGNFLEKLNLLTSEEEKEGEASKDHPRDRLWRPNKDTLIPARW